jgi:hypothetical protein
MGNAGVADWPAGAGCGEQAEGMRSFCAGEFRLASRNFWSGGRTAIHRARPAFPVYSPDGVS